MLCEGRVRWIQALSTCIHICSYGFKVKVAFISSRFENSLLRISYFSTVFNSKYKICCLNLSWMTKQFFNISVQIFTRLTRSMEKDLSHKYQLWKLFRRIRNQSAAHARKGAKCPLKSLQNIEITKSFGSMGVISDEKLPFRNCKISAWQKR